jgi:ATP-binding cassette subfamily A (ABC1) protein 3
MVEEKITMMGLTKYADKVAGSYSGGNKRKLMVSLAMIGNPPIILLDEPSTGMDPEARHDMWNVIQNISTTNKQSSVIITTHTMDEAEALSRRIAILVEGEMKCIGQKQYLKDKFGQGYEIDLSLVEPT